ncbi:MFS transporter [Paenibacillus hamazuiensis]|uniref:MFS transporter n=1 Tax=Paenibacillus hamazuiensis TaxID=2936508 RepID=UPI00200E963A|nr:MFS transporter [Paenibacillus hamazuiensis]
MKPVSHENVLRTFSFSFYMTMAVVTSYFPLYFQSRGLSTMQIGLLYSTGPLIGIFSNLFWGIVSDKWRTVKKLLIIVLAGQLLMSFIMFRSDHFLVLTVMATLFYFFQTPTNSLTDSLTLLTISGTKKSYASFRVFGSLGFAVAALVFGMYLKKTGASQTATLYLGVVGITLLVSLMLRDARGSVKKLEFTGLLKVIARKRFVLFMLTVLVASVSTRFNDTFLALFMQRLGADPSLVGWSWMTSAVSEIPVFFFLAKYGHRYKELPLLVIAGLMFGLRFLLMGFVNDPLWIIPLQALHSLSFGIFLPTVIRCMQQFVPDQYRATGQALYAVIWSGVSGLISGSAGGWIFQQAGPHSVYFTGSVLGFVAMAGFWALHVTGRQADTEP